MRRGGTGGLAVALGLAWLGLDAGAEAPAAPAGDAVAGQAVYQANCVSCHGESGRGDGPAAEWLDPPPRDFSRGDFRIDANESGAPGEDEDLLRVILEGAAPFGGSALMAGWPLSDAQARDVVAFIRTLQQP